MMSFEQPFDVQFAAQDDSWFSSQNAMSRIMGFSFLVNVLHGLLHGQGAVAGAGGLGGELEGGVIDSVRLFLLGWVIEGGRRFLSWILGRFKPLQYSIVAQFTESDPAYEWIVLLLTEEKIWSRSRISQWSVKLESKKQEKDDNDEDHAEYVPTYDQPQLFKWKGYWVQVSQREDSFYEPGKPYRKLLYLTMYTRDMGALSAMVEEARKRYLKTSRPHVMVHTADQKTYGSDSPWNGTKRKARRPLSSIILQEGVLDSLIEDAREFIAAEDWYSHAGIPHRRGYLLYGPPGTGKSSTIYAMAGELGLEIYSLSLASGFVDDSNVDDDENDWSDSPMGYNGQRGRGGARSAVTLSGLLNVLDGVASEEGKIFFATTNYKIQYKLATREQAVALFLRFYPVSFTTLQFEILEDGEKSVHLTPSKKQAILEHEFSTAELQGFLLSCKQNPGRAVEEIAKWVENEKNEKVAREKREEERKARLKEKKEAKEAKKLQGGLARLGFHVGDANGGEPSSSGSVTPPLVPTPGDVSGPVPTVVEAPATNDALTQPTHVPSTTVIPPDPDPASASPDETAAIIPVIPLPVTKSFINDSQVNRARNGSETSS
ncbi:P-loop containing nucleoside triphosphate hydrolase protein [Gymnopilus junonius]|uniref:P-loop containing nucleoside triphosphate hydrolase protein n=1 Tax=Gymnopilus junonius TaxID=109634 RepID=A0A9P5THK8_GYMJU|nr:P-loop containing nucleoside triphosphate hydrolase protein [Gymnopilus junonius]